MRENILTIYIRESFTALESINSVFAPPSLLDVLSGVDKIVKLTSECKV